MLWNKGHVIKINQAGYFAHPIILTHFFDMLLCFLSVLNSRPNAITTNPKVCVFCLNRSASTNRGSGRVYKNVGSKILEIL